MATYTAWDGNDYPLPTPEDWYLASDDRWWPDGHGPGPAPDVAPTRTIPSWTTDEEATIYSSPPPSAAAVGAIPDSLRESGTGSGGKGRTILVLGVVLFALLAIGGAAYMLLASDDDEAASPASTLFPTDEGDGDQVSPDTTQSGDEPEVEVSVVPGKGSIEDPYVIGEQVVIQYTDGASGEQRTWAIEVLGEASNITQAVLDENQFNDAPPGDQQFMGVPIRVTYVSGPAPASLFELTFKAVGPSGLVLTTFDPSCGVIPDALDTFAEIFEGGTVDGSICWSASPGDADDLTMLIEVFLEDTEIYVDLES